MGLDPSIILSGQQFDLMGAINAGRESAMQQKAFDQQNALAELYRTQGAGMLAGDQNSLNALAQFDPAAALGLKQTQTQMAYSAEDQQMQRDKARADAEAALKAQADTLTAGQVAQEAAALEDALSGAAFFYQNKDQAGYTAFLQQNGVDPAQFPFEAFPAHAAKFGGVIDAMKAFAPSEPLSPEGKLAADAAAGLVAPGTVSTPDTVVNVGGEGDTFYKELDKKSAEMFSTLQDEGIQAGRTLGMIDRLDGLLQNTATGGMAAVTQMAGEYGIDLGGLGDVQAVQALINQIVPQQRQPGSGPMSDADLALFKQSVPRLINQPGGNAIIVATMRDINKYVQEQAAIADAVANREITPAEGRKALKALANPLDGFGKKKDGGGISDGDKGGPTGNVTTGGVKWSIQE